MMKSLSSPPSSEHGGLSTNTSMTSSNSSCNSVGSLSAGSSPSPVHVAKFRLKSGDKTSPKASPSASQSRKMNSLSASGSYKSSPASRSKDSVSASSSKV